MTNNLQRFKNDLERLIHEGHSLELAMQRDIWGKEFDEQVKTNLKSSEAIKEFLAKIPDFKKAYESWYSESLALLKQILPDRVENFISMYEKPKGRKELSHSTYVIQDYLQNTSVTNGLGEVVVSPSSAFHQFEQQYAILKASKKRFESSLFEIRQLMQADLFDSELDAARELQRNKFFRAAGAVAGVVLEKHLAQVCIDHSIKIAKKHPGISDLNEALKTNGVIEISQWRHISLLGDIRNLCDHNKNKEPTFEHISDLIDGTNKIIKTIV